MTSIFTLPAGTACYRNGIPFVLQREMQIECHPDNWPLIKSRLPECKKGCTTHESHTPDALNGEVFRTPGEAATLKVLLHFGLLTPQEVQKLEKTLLRAPALDARSETQKTPPSRAEGPLQGPLDPGESL